MLAAILTTVLFALSGVTGQHVAYRLGGLWGNLVRLVIATALLGGVVLWLWPGSLQGHVFAWFFLSGLIGFGVGDVALFLAYERVGSRLAVLLTLCLAPLFAMVMEWAWLGNAVTFPVVVCALLIVAGVVLAIRPGPASSPAVRRRGSYVAGVVASVVAGFGQGAGAVLSRKAEEVALEMDVAVNGISAAFQRVFAGLVFAVAAVLLVRWLFPRSPLNHQVGRLDRKVAPWMIATVLTGPVVGVACFQWALQSLESGIVLAVVATTPIVMMPMAAITEGDRPGPSAIVGAALGVAGVILLYLWA